MTVAQSAIPPITDFIVRMSDEALSPALVSFNATLNTALNVDDTLASLKCINSTLYALPNVTAASLFIGLLQAGTADIANNATAIRSALITLNEQKTDVANAVTALNSDLTSLQASFSSLNGVLADTSTNVTAASQLHGDLFRPSASGAGPIGLAVSAQTDLATVPRQGSTAAARFPALVDLNGAAGAAGDVTTPGTMQRMANGNWLMEGNPGEISTLVGRLRGILTSLSPGNIPNYTATAAALTAISARVTAATTGSGAIVAPLRRNLGHLQSQLASLPSNATINGHLSTLDFAVNAVDLSNIRTAVVSVGNVISSLPPFDDLLTELHKVNSLPAVLPCMRTLNDQLATLNSTLVTLPSSFSFITDLYSTLNDTIMTAVATVATAESQVRSANASIVGVNVNSYVSQIDSMSSLIQQNRGQLNVTDFQVGISDSIERWQVRLGM